MLSDAHRPAGMAVIAMGASGSGKTTLARLLATRLGGSFIEGDEFHDPASIEKMRAGIPLDDADRWPWLDRVAAALRQAIAADGVAVAACSALKWIHRERLRNAVAVPVRFILLEADTEELRRRLARRSGHYMPASLIESQVATLERPRPAERVLMVDATSPPDRLCEISAGWLSGQSTTA